MLADSLCIAFSTRQKDRPRAASVQSNGADILLNSETVLPAVRFLEKPRGQNVKLNQENTMALRSPFRSPFPFGRRKRSLEDTVAGADFNQYGPMGNPFAYFPASGGTVVPASRHDTYDPVNAQYPDMSPEYEEPDPWFEGMRLPSTPQFAGPAEHPASEMAEETASAW